MELSGQHHASAALLPRKRPPVPFVFLESAGIWIPDQPARSVVAILIKLPRLVQFWYGSKLSGKEPAV